MRDRIMQRLEAILGEQHVQSLREEYWRTLGYVRELRKRTWQRWHNPRRVSNVAMVLGCYRSGTTMTVRKLDQSWDVELHNDGDLSAFTPENYIRDYEVVHRLVEKSFAKVVLFKPNNELYRTAALIDEYKTDYSDVKILVIYRHYRDVVKSILKAKDVLAHIKQAFPKYKAALAPEARGKIEALRSIAEDDAALAAVFWAMQNTFYFDQHLADDPQVMLLNYEAIVRHPDEQFRGISDFIGVAFTPTMAEGIYRSSVGKCLGVDLPDEIDQACSQLYWALCEAGGYTIRFCDSEPA